MVRIAPAGAELSGTDVLMFIKIANAPTIVILQKSNDYAWDDIILQKKADEYMWDEIDFRENF